jgi:hypothetical protein
MQSSVGCRQRVTARRELVSEQAGGAATSDSHQKATVRAVAFGVFADMLVSGDAGPGRELEGDAA